jgi:hypothetical protein
MSPDLGNPGAISFEGPPLREIDPMGVGHGHLVATSI